MNTWKVILATLVIFTAGLVVGGLFVKRTSASPNPTAARPPGMNPGQFRLQALRHYMVKELNLTPEQDAQIDKIISASQSRTQELWTPVQASVRKETEDACDQIRAVLTPEQQTKFDARSKEHPGERGERGERGLWRGPGGPGFPPGEPDRFKTNGMRMPGRGGPPGGRVPFDH